MFLPQFPSVSSHGGFQIVMGVPLLMDGLECLESGKSQSKMYDDWGYPHDDLETVRDILWLVRLGLTTAVPTCFHLLFPL